MKTFKSDNTSGVHPSIMDALIKANYEHAIPYGEDPLTFKAEKKIKSLFSKKCSVFLVMNGTGANVIGLGALIKQFQGVICADTAHINVDECGAFEGFTGSKLIQIENRSGKLYPDMIKDELIEIGNEHRSQPKVISISQVTELGTIYSIEELKDLANFAHDNGLYLHVDGARISNAIVSSGFSIDEMICKTGVDMFSFGGTKNGMMFGEAIVSFNKEASNQLKYIRKQGMQLLSKMRYISAQYIAFLEDDLWLENGKKSNDMMHRLYKGLSKISSIKIDNPPSANIMFSYMPQKLIDKLLNVYPFYQMSDDGDGGEIRLVTSFDTTEKEIDEFIIEAENY